MSKIYPLFFSPPPPSSHLDVRPWIKSLPTFRPSFSPANLDATSCSPIRTDTWGIYNSVHHSFFTLLDDLDEDLHGADEDGREGLDLLGGAGERLPVHLVRQVVCPLRHLSSHLE